MSTPAQHRRLAASLFTSIVIPISVACVNLTVILSVTLGLGPGAPAVGAQEPAPPAAWSGQRQDTTVPVSTSGPQPAITTASTTAPATSNPAATTTSQLVTAAETTTTPVSAPASTSVSTVAAAPVGQNDQVAAEKFVEEEPAEEEVADTPPTTRARTAASSTTAPAAGFQSSVVAPAPPTTTAAAPAPASRGERIVWLVVAALCVVGLLIAMLTGRYWWYTNPKRGYVRSRAVLSQKALRDHPDTDVLQAMQGGQRRVVEDTAEVALPPPLLAQDPRSQGQEQPVTAWENG